MTGTLTARARALADTEELAGEATRILGSARTTGLDPQALSGLTGAAYILGAAPLAVYRAAGPACPDEAAFIDALADTEDEITARYRAARRLHDHAAGEALAAAGEALAAARAMPVRDKCTGCHGRRATAVAAARARITDCETAADVTASLAARLARALTRIRAVPADIGETYESVYNLLRSGGRMPLGGRWITGEEPAPARGRRTTR